MSGSAGKQDGQDASWRPKANPWFIAVAVTCAAFMEILDTTIVNVSLPHIAGAVSVSYDDATWALTSYLVANAIVLTISGWLGRLLGRKRYFMICIAMFTVCSFLCGISTSLTQLVAFRLAQGFFGGGLQPNQQSIILDTFPPAKRGQAFSIVAIATIFAPVIGPTLGGWITDNYSWRWIFFINIPVGLLGFLAVGNLVEDPPWVVREHERGSKRVDYIGLSLIVIGLGFLQVMLDRGEDNDWFGSSEIRVFALLAAFGIIGAIVWLSTARNPIVSLEVFKDRNFAVGSLMIFSFGMILYSSSVLLPQLTQQQLGYTATLAGLILSPGALLILLLIPLVTRVLLPNVQTRFIIATGFFLLGVSFLYAHGQVTPDMTFNHLVLIRASQMLGLAFLFVPNSTIAYSTVPKELNSDASALFVMFRNVAGSIGISLSTAFIIERSQAHQSYLAARLQESSPNFQSLLQHYESAVRASGQGAGDVAGMARGLIDRTLISQASFLGYEDVFFYCAIAAFCVVPLTLLFHGTRGGGAPAH